VGVAVQGTPPEVWTADQWTEHVDVRPDTEVLGRFTDGPAAGGAAWTVRRRGAGSAWYLATRADSDGLRAVLDAVYGRAGIRPERDLPDHLDVVERRAGDIRYRFLINNGEVDAELSCGERAARELLTGTDLPPGAALTVAAGAVRIVRTAAAP
jgi:beta-galactosidase